MNGEKYYEHLVRGIEMLTSGEFNSLWVVGPPGIGKSTVVDETLTRLGSSFAVFRGDMSDAKMHEFISDNSDKILVFRDVTKFLTRLACIDILKALSEKQHDRLITRGVYADHGVPNDVIFTGKIIFELNSIPVRFKEDLDALFSRGIYCEVHLGRDEIEAIMKERIVDEPTKLATEFLLARIDLVPNIRMQDMAINIVKMSLRDNRNVTHDLELFFNNHSLGRMLLKRLTGDVPINKRQFAIYLCREMGWGLTKSYAKINEWIEIGDMFTSGLDRKGKICIKPFGG